MLRYLTTARAIFITALFFLILPLSAAYLTFMPTTVTQPDGSTLDCFASGDEYHNWLHDKDGYTIIQSPTTGYYTFARRSGSEVVAGDLIAGRDNPALRGLTPNINISKEAYKELRSSKFQVPGTRDAPTIGTINNLVVYIRFSGESEFGQSISTYDGWFNTGTSSQKNYFLEASYNQLTVNTTFYPAASGGNVVSWQDSHTRGYFQPYNATTNTIGYNGDAQRQDREFTLLAAAIAGVASAVPADLVIDSDGDGNVDNVVFVISGASGGWSDLLWPHRWAIYDRTVTLRGKRVYDFNFQLRDFLNTYNVGVICHEFFHTLGAPDLYHYTEEVFTPVGSWDLMESNTNPPQHMGAYMKWKYGDWIPSIPTLTTNGTYSLNPLTSSTGNSYRINSPNSSTEYFIVEYRRKTGTYENSLPGSGMLIYRINTTVGDGNADGPPDEVYIYRPGGTTAANGTISSAHYSSAVGRTAINTTTNPTPFLTSGAAGGLSLSNIGAAGTTISFTNNGGLAAGVPTCEISSPLDEAAFNLGESITINVTAADTRSVSRVEFYLDGAATPAYTDYSSPYSWTWNTIGYSAGSHIILAKTVDNENLFATDQITVFLLAPADEGFESGNFNAFSWENISANPWTVQSTEKYSGTYAAKSGAIVDNATTSLSVSLNITSAGNISFFQKVSSESDYDFLKFYVDNVQMGSWSGLGNWTLQSYAISTGSHTFRWTYSKDVSVVGGSDCAWIDHINFPPSVVILPPTITWNPASITKSLLTNATTSQALLIGNTGNQTLNYTCSLPSNTSNVLNQGFENAGSIPTGWTQEYVSGAAVAWIFAAGGYSSHPATAYEGSYNARLYNASYTAAVTRLYTPAINLSTASSASLTFWHTQELWSPDQDELRVYYRSSAAGAWNLLSTYTNSITAWTMETINLPSLSGTYYIGFEGTAKYGYGVCLDNVAVTAQLGAVSPWLSLNSGTTVSGSIADGGANQSINVGFNSTGLTAGTYNSTLTLTSNSVSNSTVSIPVTLTVTAPTPQINVSVTSLAFGTQLINTSQSNSFQISNAGTATLSGNIVTPTGYTVALSRAVTDSKQAPLQMQSRSAEQSRNSLAYTVSAGATNTYSLTFSPTAVQAYNGSVSISHNAAGASKSIALTGQGGKPTIGLSASTFSKSLAPNATGTSTLVISNSGNLSLNYALSVSGTPGWLTVNGGNSVTSSIAVGAAAHNISIGFNATGKSPGTYNASLSGTSNDPANPTYSITVSLTVSEPIAITSPLGGEIWNVGSLHAITWNYSGIQNSLKLWYSTNNGTNWIDAGNISTLSGTNSYNWLVPNAASTTVKVKLMELVAPQVSSTSNTFQIVNPAPPSVPQNLQISHLSGNVSISWDSSTGNPTGYYIYRSSSVEFLPAETELIGTKTAAETSLTVPASGLKAFYRVVAYRN